MRKKLVCISCPVGCEITAQIENGKVNSIEGNRCPRGEAYARQEAVEPVRVVATSVKVVGGERPLISVRTDRPVPRRLIPEIMATMRGLVVEAPVEIGQVLEEDLAGAGARLVATRAVRQEKAYISGPFKRNQ
jgi:CxxC motif-containing protein